MPSHTPAPSPTTLSPGQSLWLCLAPGTTLQATLGEVAVQWATAAPLANGLTWYAPLQTRLQAGEQLSWTGQTQAVWVQLHAAHASTSQIQLLEMAAGPGLLKKSWHQLRAAFSASSKAAKGAGYRSGLHTAR